jgi:hypothetical protein
LGHSSVICGFSFFLVVFSSNTLKLGLTLMFKKVLYKNCDCQATIRKKIWSCTKLALEAAKEQKILRELASIYKKYPAQISK